MPGLPKAYVNVQALVMGLLVGRDGELEVLRRMAEEARNGSRVAVVIDGVAGIGKSRLVDVAVGVFLRAGEVTTVAHGVELVGGELPYAAVSEWLRNLVVAVGMATVREAASSDLPNWAAGVLTEGQVRSRCEAHPRRSTSVGAGQP